MLKQTALDPVIYTDDVDDTHAQTIADQLSQALRRPIDPSDVKPAANQPLTLADQQEVDQEDQPEPEVVDLMRGLQGKPRTAPAQKLLQEKKRMLEKKYGREINLITKEK